MPTWIFEIYLLCPAKDIEDNITSQISAWGGMLDYRESPRDPSSTVILTYEFSDLKQAEQAADAMRRNNYHVEGPVQYGD